MKIFNNCTGQPDNLITKKNPTGERKNNESSKYQSGIAYHRAFDPGLWHIAT